MFFISKQYEQEFLRWSATARRYELTARETNCLQALAQLSLTEDERRAVLWALKAIRDEMKARDEVGDQR